MTRLALMGVLLGLLTACGDNGNDVGIFTDESSGGTGLGDGSTDTSTAEGSDAATSDSSGDSSSSGTDGTAEGSASGTDGNTTTSSGGSGTTSGETSSGGMGGSGATAGEETTSGGTAGQTSGTGGETSGTGGQASGTGGGSSSGGGSTGGSGGGNNGTCPEERPEANAECDASGVCDYGAGCEPDLMACEEGHWVEVKPEPVTCADFGPGSYPENGDGCECLGELRCQFLDCDGRGTIRASCSEGTWEVHDSDCVSRPCAANTDGEDVPMCEPGEICVASSSGLAITYECEPNPCADARLQNSCECARAICPESDAWRCEMQEDATVLACICDQCN